MAEQLGSGEFAPLTARLAGALELRGHGLAIREIGNWYGVGDEMARVYLRKARRLLGADTDAEAIIEATRLGIIDLTGERLDPNRPPGLDVSTDWSGP